MDSANNELISRISRLKDYLDNLDLKDSTSSKKLFAMEKLMKIDSDFVDDLHPFDPFHQTPHFAFYESDRLTRFISCSEEVTRLLGYSFEELKRKPSMSLVVDSDRERVSRCYMRWIKEKRNDMSIIFNVLTKSGLEIKVEQQTHFDFDNDGNFVKAVHFLKDLTTIDSLNKRIEEAEYKSKAMADSTSEAIFISENGMCTGQNHAAQEMYGYTDDEAIGRMGVEWISPQDREMVMNKMRNGDSESYFVMSMRKDGSFFPSEIKAKVIDYNGKRIRITSVKDLSKTFMVEKKLEENELKYKTIIDFTLDIIFLLDMRGKIVFLNNSISKILGYELGAMIGNPFYNYVPKSEYPKYFKNLVRIYTKQNVINNFVSKVIHSNGNLIDVEINGRLISLAGKTYALGTMRDISERIKSDSKIREMEKSYFELFNRINDSILILSKNNKFIEVNDGALKTYGYSKNDIIGSDPSFLGGQGNDYSKISELMAKAYDGIPSCFEFNARRKNGELFLKEVDLYPGLYEGEKVIIAVGRDITERRKAEFELRESESRHRELYNMIRLMADNMPDMLWAKNLEKKFVFVNKSICDNLLIANSIEEPIGKDDLFFAQRQRNLYPDNQNFHTFGELCQDSDSITLDSNMPMSFDEFGNVRGKFLHLKVNKAPIYNQEGEMIGIVGSGRDVTKSKIAENIQKLQYSIADKISSCNNSVEVIKFVQQSLSNFSGNKDVSILKYLPESNSFTYIDDGTPTLLNVETMDDYILHQEVVKKLKPILLKGSELKKFDLSENQQAKNIKCWLGVPIKTGAKSVGLIVLKDYNNQDAFDKEMVIVVEIIANQISNYLMRHENEDQLLILGKAVEQSQVGISIFNSEGNFTFVNPGFERIFKYTKKEVVGLNHRLLWPNRISAEFFVRLKKQLESGNNWNGELMAINKKGKEIWVNSFVGPVNLSSTNEVSYVAIFEDITSRKQNFLAMMEAKNLAERSDSLKTHFLQNMSHEIRTPLNGIIGFANLIDSNISDPSDFEDYAKIIRNSGNRLMELINNILDLSKIESGNIEINLVRFDLNKTLSDVHSILKIKADLKSLQLNLKSTDGKRSLFIVSDEAKIHQIVLNLVNNAIKFTDSGHVEFGYEIENGKLVIFVSDTGVGIAEQDIPNLFSRFYRVSNSKNLTAEGSGLGLAITKGLVNVLGGEIVIDSSPAMGSVFKVILPDIAIEENQVEKAIGDTSHSEEKITILIAEDDEISMDLIKTILGTKDYVYITVANGEEAVKECLNNKKISMVLMDLKMPILDGIEATKKIKSFRPNLPVIAQTAFAFPNDKELALKAGCDRFITKPISKNVLLKLVGEFL